MNFLDLFGDGLFPLHIFPSHLIPGAVISLAAVTAFFAVFVIWNTLIERDATVPRIREMTLRRKTLMSELRAPSRHQQRKSLRGISWMQRVVEYLKLKGSERTGLIADRLARGGWRSGDALVVFLFFKVALLVLFGTVSVFLFWGLGVWDLSPAMRLMAVLCGAGMGFYTPDIFVHNQTVKRQDALRKALPDALDLMVICAEAGLSLDASLQRVVRELGKNTPEISEELDITAVELGFLPERRQALDNLNRRTNLPSIRGVVNTLIQTEKYGTPLAQSLRVLAAEYRVERLLKAEEKASRLPATMTIPLIFFILPPLFVVLLGPGVLSIIDGLSSL